jgi:hypothetical protein
MTKFKINFEETEISPILEHFKKWRKLIRDNSIVKSPEYVPEVKNLLELCGFTNISDNGEKFNATLGDNRYIGITWDGQFPETPFKVNETIYYDYIVKENL